jgi:hypothetical protein
MIRRFGLTVPARLAAALAVAVAVAWDPMLSPARAAAGAP